MPCLEEKSKKVEEIILQNEEKQESVEKQGSCLLKIDRPLAKTVSTENQDYPTSLI